MEVGSVVDILCEYEGCRFCQDDKTFKTRAIKQIAETLNSYNKKNKAAKFAFLKKRKEQSGIRFHYQFMGYTGK